MLTYCSLAEIEFKISYRFLNNFSIFFSNVNLHIFCWFHFRKRATRAINLYTFWSIWAFIKKVGNAISVDVGWNERILMRGLR